VRDEPLRGTERGGKPVDLRHLDQRIAALCADGQHGAERLATRLQERTESHDELLLAAYGGLRPGGGRLRG
jgi:hypothetical protein